MYEELAYKIMKMSSSIMDTDPLLSIIFELLEFDDFECRSSSSADKRFGLIMMEFLDKIIKDEDSRRDNILAILTRSISILNRPKHLSPELGLFVLWIVGAFFEFLAESPSDLIAQLLDYLNVQATCDEIKASAIVSFIKIIVKYVEIDMVSLSAIKQLTHSMKTNYDTSDLVHEKIDFLLESHLHQPTGTTISTGLYLSHADLKRKVLESLHELIDDMNLSTLTTTESPKKSGLHFEPYSQAPPGITPWPWTPSNIQTIFVSPDSRDITNDQLDRLFSEDILDQRDSTLQTSVYSSQMMERLLSDSSAPMQKTRPKESKLDKTSPEINNKEDTILSSSLFLGIL